MILLATNTFRADLLIITPRTAKPKESPFFCTTGIKPAQDVPEQAWQVQNINRSELQK